MSYDSPPEVVLNLCVGCRVLLRKLHPHTGLPVPLGARRCDPDDAAGNRNFLRLVHQRKQHKDFIADAVAFVGRDKKATIFQKGHIGRIEHRLVLDRQ